MPGSSVPSEQVFSACGVLVNKLCCALSKSMIDMMIFLSTNQLLQAAPGVTPTSTTATPSAVAAAVNQIVLDDEEEEPELPDLDTA